jgi:alpha-1,2-mannosyltransferase
VSKKRGGGGSALHDLGTVALAALPPVVLTSFLVFEALQHAVAVDFSNAYLSAAHDLLRGRSPYHADTVTTGEAFVYPPIGGFLVTPFALMPWAVAAALWTAIVGLASVGVLRLLAVRQWRYYGAAVLWYPTLSGIQTGNLTLVLAAFAALVWLYRDRPLGAVLAGLAVCLKLFLWPLVLFLVLTRRFRRAAAAGGVAAAGILVPWAAIGFAGLRGYPSLLAGLERWEGARSHTIASLVAPYIEWSAGRGLTYACGAALLVLAWRLRGDDRRAFLVLLAAALELSPVVWMSYLVLLSIPLALEEAALGWWLLPLVLWLPELGLASPLLGSAVVLAVPAAIFTRALRGATRHPSSAHDDVLGPPLRSLAADA